MVALSIALLLPTKLTNVALAMKNPSHKHMRDSHGKTGTGVMFLFKK